MSIIHTKIGPALKDPSTWASLVAGFTAASLLPNPFNYLTAICAIPGVLLRGGGTKEQG